MTILWGISDRLSISDQINKNTDFITKHVVIKLQYNNYIVMQGLSECMQMTNNEGNQKYRMTDIVQCNSVSVGALRTIYKFNGILRKFDQFKLCKLLKSFNLL